MEDQMSENEIRKVIWRRKEIVDESFKYGKRAALRPLKTALSAHPYLTSEGDAK